jgi:Lar family restriction alleviation protein
MNDETPKLLPCPFCGGAASALEGAYRLCRVECETCETTSKWFNGYRNAATHWNRRTTPATPAHDPVLTNALLVEGARTASE